MNASNFAHAGLAISAQIIIGLCGILAGLDVPHSFIMGGLFSTGFYLGREVAQAERKAGTPPWWSGFVVTKWSQDSIFDLLCPVVACSALITLSTFLVQ